MVFAISTLLYNTLWMIAVRWVPELPAVELGFDYLYNVPESAVLVTGVRTGSPAEKSGMLKGDRIVAINGGRFDDSSSLYKAYRRHTPGDSVRLTIERPGQTAPIVLTSVFRARVLTLIEGSLMEFLTGGINKSYPVLFVLVGLTVLFLRVEDRNVWLLALLFASFTATPTFPDDFSMTAGLRIFTMAYRSVFLGMLGSLFYFFFALFPSRSPVDRRMPWLKWVSVAFGVSCMLYGLQDGRPLIPRPLAMLWGERHSHEVFLWIMFAFVVLGMVSLAANFYRTDDPQTRRKIRVIFWGTVVGITPALIRGIAQSFTNIHLSVWLDSVVTGMMFVFPLSFAYAVVKHRILEIPVLLKRSARYLLVQRGFTLLLSLMSVGIMILFALSFTPYLNRVIEIAQPLGIALGAVFGGALLWGGSIVHNRISRKIDQAFFRSAYDARVILEDLAKRTATETDRGDLAGLLESHLRQALRPSSLVVYFQGANDHLIIAAGAVPELLKTISADLPVLKELARKDRPRVFVPADESDSNLTSPLMALNPDCLVPIVGRGERLLGLLVLGPRLSEEPYSGEDMRMLASIANQASITLQNITMAEDIAERMETERRVSREMEIAKAVQGKLFPQHAPHLETLDLAAQCIQARSVGGDYYDFLDLGLNHMGLVLADVSGKGIHAALLMANLQACLRSQSSVIPQDPLRMLKQVNRMLWKSTDSEHFATLFFGMYDDSTRTLEYVNCGHNPPLLMHRSGVVERLEATATVIGIFEQWECSVSQVRLAPDDLLVIYSDGVTEATYNDDQYGEERLIAELLTHHDLPAEEILTAILTSVQRFSTGAQSDDLTVLTARARNTDAIRRF
jgi:sigma-B regulation protein RsbU (phosphoserine phosphatase)